MHWKQNGAIELRNRVPKNLPKEETFRKLLNISYFMARSTCKAEADLDTSLPDIAGRLMKGQGDCETNSFLTFLNFEKLSPLTGHADLLSRIRVVYGINKDSKGTKKGHTWLEIYLDNEWKIMECNYGSENALFKTRFDPKRNYHKKVLAPDPQTYRRISGLRFRRLGKGQVKYYQELYTLPASVEKELRK